MFIVKLINDRVRIHPKYFGISRAEAIIDELHRKYANKVLHKVGLCIRVLDLFEVKEGIFHPAQDGTVQYLVRFRLIIFRPFKGEILVGKIFSSSLSEGIRVSLDFFHDIIIPPPFLQPGTEFNQDECIWVWKYLGNDLFMEKDDLIRFRVEIEEFVDSEPLPATTSSGDPGSSTSAHPAGSSKSGSVLKVAPYSLVCSACEPGLGLCSWWE